MPYDPTGYGQGRDCPTVSCRNIAALLFFGIYPIVAFALLRGVETIGLPVIDTTLWGGMMITLLMSVVGIVFSLPLGIILALGRRSELPIVKAVCVFYIEIVRGVPFITVLFMMPMRRTSASTRVLPSGIATL